MRRFGVRFQSPLRGTLHLARTNAFFLGGGKALMNSYYAAAERLGIQVVYDAEVVGLELPDGQFRAAIVRSGGRDRTIRARVAVMATGGFESNIDWLREIWGDAAANFIIRGTPYNKGTLLRLMLDSGAQPVGDRARVSRGRRRCARAEVRRRHRDAARLPLARRSSSTSMPSASTTRAKISGRSATPSGERLSLDSPTRSRFRSLMPRRPADSCRQCFRRRRRAPSESLRRS